MKGIEFTTTLLHIVCILLYKVNLPISILTMCKPLYDCSFSDGKSETSKNKSQTVSVISRNRTVYTYLCIKCECVCFKFKKNNTLAYLTENYLESRKLILTRSYCKFGGSNCLI